MLLNSGLQRRFKRRITVGTGGSAPTTALIAGMEKLRCTLVHLYGLTESLGPATVCRFESYKDLDDERYRFLARQGVRHPFLAYVGVVDKDGHEVSSDGMSIGEVVLRGGTLMGGYYRDEQATIETLSGGVLHTGDLGVRHPDNFIEVKDRAKDIIISGGENISTIEIESVLHQHPAVYLAAVVAVPDSKWGEVPCACVELKENRSQPTPEELIDFCRTRLAGFKVPKKIVYRELPKTATGKIQKFELRKEFSAQFS
jgi:fatty-acyl-CoA synthase